MAFTITAELPLGTYRAHTPSGEPERLPSVLRLHSALLAAAGFGPRAEPDPAGSWGPCPADEFALRWMEENPPDEVNIPALKLNFGQAVAYRKDGALEKRKKGFGVKMKNQISNSSTAVDGPFIWIWHDMPPAPVQVALTALCRDVPYLGTTESPVRLLARVDPVPSGTHALDPHARWTSTGHLALAGPLPGRLDELRRAHHDTQAVPKVARDKCRTVEKSLAPSPPRLYAQEILYRPIEQKTSDIPWERAFVVPLELNGQNGMDPKRRIAWAVAAHRALVKIIDHGLRLEVPPVVTGSYPEGVTRPANRIAIHLLDPSAPVHDEEVASPLRLAVMCPSDTDAAIVDEALAALESIRGPGGRLARVKVKQLRQLNGGRFWSAPASGMTRLWRTLPAAIPDTRGRRRDPGSFESAALLSLGFVWKDLLPPTIGRGDAYHHALTAAVSACGVRVLQAEPLRTNEVHHYAHRVNPGAVIRPYHATLTLGSLTSNTTVQAIGQSRHLGGGLLVPLDVPTQDLSAEIAHQAVQS